MITPMHKLLEDAKTRIEELEEFKKNLQKICYDLEKENERLQNHISKMSCCCAGCTKHNQDLSNFT